MPTLASGVGWVPSAAHGLAQPPYLGLEALKCYEVKIFYNFTPPVDTVFEHDSLDIFAGGNFPLARIHQCKILKMDRVLFSASAGDFQRQVPPGAKGRATRQERVSRTPKVRERRYQYHLTTGGFAATTTLQLVDMKGAIFQLMDLQQLHQTLAFSLQFLGCCPFLRAEQTSYSALLKGHCRANDAKLPACPVHGPPPRPLAAVVTREVNWIALSTGPS